jgi:hypothetical protein|tara:strand:+ start:348 stop:494 length:147 start_codon:yes stop_codon:yes gene_type:complete
VPLRVETDSFSVKIERKDARREEELFIRRILDRDGTVRGFTDGVVRDV